MIENNTEGTFYSVIFRLCNTGRIVVSHHRRTVGSIERTRGKVSPTESVATYR